MQETSRALAHPCPRPDQAVRRLRGGRRHRLRRRARRIVRLPRAQRRRQDSTMRMIGCVSPVTGGTLPVMGMDPATRRAADPRRLGVVPAAGHARQGADGPREPRHLRPLLRAVAGPRARRRADELLEFAQLTERANDQVEPLSGGMKRRLTIARVAHQRARAAAPRRADDRASIRRRGTCSGIACIGSSSAA